MKHAAIALGLALVATATATACGALGAPGGGVDGPGGPPGDAGAGCSIDFQFDPSPAIAGSNAIERVTASVEPSVPLTYQWQVTFDGSDAMPTPVGTDMSAVDFAIPVAGEYVIGLEVTSNVTGVFCTKGQTLTVTPPNAKTTAYRARVTPPPASGAPPIETPIVVTGGGDQAINLTFPQLASLSGTVTASGFPVFTYVRVAPPSSATYVEAYSSDASGFGPLSVVAGPLDILLVPSDPTLAPELVHWSVGDSTAFTLGGGSAVHGRAIDVNNNPIVGAAVQLVLGGVLPSTTGFTAADGTFTLQADTSDPTLLTNVTVDVAPPTGSGLPHMTSTAGFPLGATLAIKYPTVATRDVANLPIKQGGVAVANAQVAIVGSLASFAGTIDATVTTNALRVDARTDGNGLISGSTRVPAAPVSIVVTLGSGEVEVVAVDLTAGVPASIALPAATVAGGIVRGATGTPLANVRVELAPAGALAQAGALPLETATGGDGSYAISLAAAGSYDVRVVDPFARGPLVFAAAQAPAQIADVTLAPGIFVDGVVTLPSLSVAIGASVQLLCSGCTGVAASQPVAESATDLTGTYRVSVPDPGVN